MEHITTAGPATPAPKTRWYKQLYFWVLTAILIGILVGWLAPTVGIAGADRHHLRQLDECSLDRSCS